jgi:cytochrome b
MPGRASIDLDQERALDFAVSIFFLRTRKSMHAPTKDRIQVWDLFVRTSHWLVAVGFFVAYFTEDDAMTVHAWAGYLVGALLLLRIGWGIVGPRYARFSNFVYAPGAVLSYFWGLLTGHAKRYVGHSPAGGAMIVLLIIALTATVGTGLVLYAQEHAAGPLAPFIVHTQQTGAHEHGSALEEVHETLANVTLALVIFHILGVILASFVHRENLVAAMITGRKRAPGMDEVRA